MAIVTMPSGGRGGLAVEDESLTGSADDFLDLDVVAARVLHAGKDGEHGFLREVHSR
jgi:hypothetical protein